MENKQLTIHDKDFTSKLLERVQQGIQIGTGVIVSGKKDFVLSASNILQGALNRNFLGTLKYEWDTLKGKGKIKKDYEHTEQHHACLQEMLNFIDNDNPDKVRFEFMKKLFISASTESIEDRDSLLPQQYMHVCRQLKSGEIIVLSSVYSMYVNDSWDTNSDNAKTWLESVSKYSGFEHPELIELHERNLMELGFISKRFNPGMRTISKHRNRLTNLGISICKFIAAYDTEAEDSKDEVVREQSH